jgi:ornithine cyclodeaminase/alanine dehydrogenase-like protein (mu-crystallin family)
MAGVLRFLSAADVRRALPMDAAIMAMKSAFAQLSGGSAEMPLRTRLQTPDGTTLIMPAYLKESGEVGVKVVSVFPNNVRRQQPIIYAMVLALDVTTGQPLALLEGGSLTAIRTGAGSGAATDVLARANARSVAIIGSGVQARTQLEAVCEVRSIEQVWVYGPTRARAEQFAAEMAGVGRIPKQISVAGSANEAVREADIICTATTSTHPVFDGKLVRAGTHINAVGSYLPEMQEVDEITLQRSLITVDSRESVLAEAGEILIAIANGSLTESAIHAELGEIITGTRAGRSSDDQITYFKSCGVAVQDAAAAHVALRNAELNQIGMLLPL